MMFHAKCLLIHVFTIRAWTVIQRVALLVWHTLRARDRARNQGEELGKGGMWGGGVPMTVKRSHRLWYSAATVSTVSLWGWPYGMITFCAFFRIAGIILSGDVDKFII